MLIDLEIGIGLLVGKERVFCLFARDRFGCGCRWEYVVTLRALHGRLLNKHSQVHDEVSFSTPVTSSATSGVARNSSQQLKVPARQSNVNNKVGLRFPRIRQAT
jgi:hypothetical protein